MIQMAKRYCENFEEIYGIKQDYSEAIKYFKMASDNGNPKGFACLAYMYLNGKGVEQDYKQALILYKQAANNGDKFAFWNIADMYKNGLGVDKNYNEAFKIYKHLVDLGNPEAMWALAECYTKGEGTEQNYKEALRLFRLSNFRWNKSSNAFKLFNECVDKLGVQKTEDEIREENELKEDIKKWQEEQKQNAYRDYLMVSKEIRLRFESVNTKQSNQFLSPYDSFNYLHFGLIRKGSKLYAIGAKINQKCNDVDIYYYETEYAEDYSKIIFNSDKAQYASPCITDNEEGKEIFNKFWENLGKERIQKNTTENETIVKKEDETKEKERLKQLLKKFRRHEDKLEGVAFYRHPAFRQDGGREFYPYIGVRGSATWIRVFIQYIAEDWLFVSSINVYTDNGTYRKNIPSSEMKREVVSRRVVENADCNYDYDYENIFKSLATTKKTSTIRFIGSKYYKERGFSQKEREGFAETLELKELIDKYGIIN